jgi:hypothetical protein
VIQAKGLNYTGYGGYSQFYSPVALLIPADFRYTPDLLLVKYNLFALLLTVLTVAD